MTATATKQNDLLEELTFTRFDRMSRIYPEQTAVVYLGQRFSYRRLRDLSRRFAGALRGLGVSKGDRVMIYISNCIQWVIAFLGIQRLGAVIVPVSPIYTSHELEYMIQDSGANTVICLDTNYGYVKEARKTVRLDQVIVTNLVDLLPAWKRSLGVLLDKIPSGKVDRGDGVVQFKTLLKHAPLETPVDISPMEDLSYLLYTGGTTGFPKGVPGNHAGMTSYVNDVTRDIAGERLQEGRDVYIAVNPLFHIMALGLFMSIGLNKGNTTVLMPVPQVDAILESIQRYKVRWLLGVPALYRMILENDRIDRYDLGSLTFCFCGGDVLPVEVFNRWQKRLDIPIYQVYGSTEVGHVCYSRIGEAPKPGTIGLPLNSRECVIVDPATLETVAPGESGELLVASPYTLKGYWNKPEETEKVCVEIDGKVFCRMGDYVRKDEDGELFYVERSADIIKHKGFRVSASEVEAVLQNHTTVIGACVVGVPDERVGERIKAIVVLKEDARGVGGADLIRWCSERLAAYKVPSYIEFRDMLPKSKVGKLLRREVRDEERRRMSKEKRKSKSTEDSI
jgi:long-chain acyl-CoA synthetase